MENVREVELPEPNDTRTITRKVVRNTKRGKKTYIYTKELPVLKPKGRKTTPNKTAIRSLISDLTEDEAEDVLSLMKQKIQARE